MLPAVFINPGDVTLMTVPGYPVAGTHTRYYGGEVYQAAAAARRTASTPTWRPSPPTSAGGPSCSSSTTPTARRERRRRSDFYRRVIDFAHTNQIVVVQDAAHILLSYDGPPLSFLQVEGAKEVGVEVHSMSKGFNMIGWRMGFVAGHPKIVQAFADVKDNCDSGQFMAIQQAAAAALRHPELADAIREKYRRRLQKLVAALGKVGFQAKMPGGHLLPLRRRAEGLYGPDLRQRRGSVAVPDHRAVGLLRAVGRRRGVSCASRRPTSRRTRPRKTLLWPRRSSGWGGCN